MGRKRKGCEISPETKQEVKALRAAGVPYSYIEDRFGIAEHTIWEICKAQDSDGGDLGYVVTLVNHVIYRNRPIWPPPEARVLLPLPAWASLSIARQLYDQNIISYSQYCAWLEANTPQKEATDDKG